MTKIEFKIESPSNEINYVGRIPYFFRSGTFYVNGKQIKSPTRSATPVEFNANSRLEEIVDITTDVSMIEKTLNKDDLLRILRGSDGYVSLNTSIDRHLSKMRYSSLTGFIVRPQNNAKTLISSNKEEYEKIYDYSAMIASNTGADFWGLPFPSSIPIDDVIDLWNSYVINRDDSLPYPIIFLDPSDEEFTAFQYLVPFLKSEAISSHIHVIGIHYTSPIGMQPLIRELIHTFKDIDIGIMTTGIDRSSRYRALSGIHGQELFMSDIVGVKPGRWFPKDITEFEENPNQNTPTNNVKAFSGDQLLVNDIRTYLGDRDQAEQFFTSIHNLRSNELRNMILNIVQSQSLNEILGDEELSNKLSDAFRLHELENSADEVNKSQKFAEQEEVKEYVRDIKPNLNEWLHILQSK